jgi:UDP-N-acetylglucosamine 2-epimerase (non-hydrolysing)
LDDVADHILVHTGQNFTEELNDIFFRELAIRPPDHNLKIREETFSSQFSKIVERMDSLLETTKPDRLVILGDTNSGLSAILAARRCIPVYHLEAGNRNYDPRVPEEVNRRLIDQCSTVLMPYTERSKENLIREGFRRERIFVTGNPIFEVLQHYEKQISSSDVLKRLGVEQQQYLAVTLHRSENVDEPDRLSSLMRGLGLAAARFGVPVVVSVHPRTADRIRRSGITVASSIRMLRPLGFFDFVRLEQGAMAVLTDSGTVQEECAIFSVPCVIVRDVTERPETLEFGSGVLSGADPDTIVKAVEVATHAKGRHAAPPDYTRSQVSAVVTQIVLSYRYGGQLY